MAASRAGPASTLSISLPPWGWIMVFLLRDQGFGTRRPEEPAAASVDVAEGLQALLDLLLVLLAEDLLGLLLLGEALPDDFDDVGRDRGDLAALDGFLDL